jgi:transposase-like protein
LSPEIIRLVVMMYIKYPLSRRIVEDLLAERGIEICHETVRFWWNRFGPMFAAEIRKKRVERMRAYTHWRWHLDEMYVTARAFRVAHCIGIGALRQANPNSGGRKARFSQCC